MRRLPYDDYSRAEMILRDWLAMDRTVFAGTRTFLGYVRAVITMIIATAIFLAVFHQAAWDVLLYVGFMVAAVLLLLGIFQYREIRQHHRDLYAVERCARWEDSSR